MIVSVDEEAETGSLAHLLPIWRQMGWKNTDRVFVKGEDETWQEHPNKQLVQRIDGCIAGGNDGYSATDIATKDTYLKNIETNRTGACSSENLDRVNESILGDATMAKEELWQQLREPIT